MQDSVSEGSSRARLELDEATPCRRPVDTAPPRRVQRNPLRVRPLSFFGLQSSFRYIRIDPATGGELGMGLGMAKGLLL